MKSLFPTAEDTRQNAISLLGVKVCRSLRLMRIGKGTLEDIQKTIETMVDIMNVKQYLWDHQPMKLVKSQNIFKYFIHISI